MSKFLLSGVLLLFVLLLSRGIQGVCCGADVDDDFGNDHFWFLALPDDTVIECHKQFTVYDDYALPDIHGWAWELNGCHLTSGGVTSVCAGGFNGVAATDWCDEDDGNIDEDDDDDGLGTNDIVTFSDADSSGSIAGRCSDEERITRTWTSTTSCPTAGGARISDTQIVFIEDTTPPYLCIPNDLVIECTADAATTFPQNFIFGYASTFDMCTDATLTRNVGTFAASGACAFSANVVYTATDVGAAPFCFNPSQTQTVTIRDTRPPFVTSRADVYASCDNVPTNAATAPTVSDACGLFPTAPSVTFLSERIIPGDCQNNFVSERQYTVADQCGNSDIVFVNVIVTDTIPPVFNPNIANEVFYYNCEADITFLALTATDTCSTPSVVEDRFYSESHEERLGTIVTQVFTATDECGNSVQRQYDHVVIHDVTATLAVGGATSGTKGASFTVSFTVTQTTVTNCNQLTLVVDAAGATLLGGSNACFTQAANGNIYCENPANGVALTLNLSVPTDYIPDIIRVSGVITSPYLSAGSVATAVRVVSFI